MQFSSNRILLRFLLICVLFPFISINAKAQNVSDIDTRIEFSGTDLTLGRAIADIESQTQFTFVFNTSQVKTNESVRFDRRDMTVREALAVLFDHSNYIYIIRSRFIALSLRNKTPERANNVARAQDNEPLTNDRYVQTDPNSLSAASLKRGELPKKEDPYEIERVVTIVPGEPIERNFPTPYSVYTPVAQTESIYHVRPVAAVKINMLYGIAGLTPNLSAEFGIKPKSTLELSGSYSWRGRKKAASENHKQSGHWMIRPEYRWWTCERFNGHYLGAHAFFSKYYISGHKVPMLFKKEYSYDGYAIGAGVTYGYHWAVAKRWSLEFNVGLGYAYLNYDRGSCVKCDPKPTLKTKHYFGPTRAGINLVFMIK